MGGHSGHHSRPRRRRHRAHDGDSGEEAHPAPSSRQKINRSKRRHHHRHPRSGPDHTNTNRGASSGDRDSHPSLWQRLVALFHSISSRHQRPGNSHGKDGKQHGKNGHQRKKVHGTVSKQQKHSRSKSGQAVSTRQHRHRKDTRHNPSRKKTSRKPDKANSDKGQRDEGNWGQGSSAGESSQDHTGSVLFSDPGTSSHISISISEVAPHQPPHPPGGSSGPEWVLSTGYASSLSGSLSSMEEQTRAIPDPMIINALSPRQREIFFDHRFHQGPPIIGGETGYGPPPPLPVGDNMASGEPVFRGLRPNYQQVGPVNYGHYSSNVPAGSYLGAGTSPPSAHDGWPVGIGSRNVYLLPPSGAPEPPASTSGTAWGTNPYAANPPTTEDQGHYEAGI